MTSCDVLLKTPKGLSFLLKSGEKKTKILTMPCKALLDPSLVVLSDDIQYVSTTPLTELLHTGFLWFL